MMKTNTVMKKKVENFQDLKRRLKNIKYGDEGFLDEIVIQGQEALSIIEPKSFKEEEMKIAEAVRSAKKKREGDPLMITRNQKEDMWLELSEGINKAMKKLESRE